MCFALNGRGHVFVYLCALPGVEVTTMVVAFFHALLLIGNRSRGMLQDTH